MTPEEFGKVHRMLHPLEGMGMYLDILTDKVGAHKGADSANRGARLLCIRTLETARRQVLEIVVDLLQTSEKIESERQARQVMMMGQARAQGKTEALDHLAAVIAEQRRAAEEPAPSVPTRSKRIKPSPPK